MRLVVINDELDEEANEGGDMIDDQLKKVANVHPKVHFQCLATSTGRM